MRYARARSSRRFTLASLAVGVLLAVACGDSSDGDGRVPALDAGIDGALDATPTSPPTEIDAATDVPVDASADAGCGTSPGSAGTACGTGLVCQAGACVAGCLIDGAFFVANAVRTTDECQQCRPELLTTAWSSRGAVPLLTGTVDPKTEGWKESVETPSTVTFEPDHVHVQTSTLTGARSGGQHLYYLEGAVPIAAPFEIRFELQIESVNAHNSLDSAAAILGSFVPSVGNSTDRSEMVYLDPAAVGWADDTQSAAATIIDGAYHTFTLSVNAARVATMSIDGVTKLTRNNYTTSGTIAVGDQSNDAKLDSAMRIRSVSRACLE